MRNSRFLRRDVLKAGSAAVGSLFAAQALAGSLEPPAGTPSPTGRSLKEVEPRTPINGLAAGGGALHLVTAGGSFKLTGNISVPAGSVGIRVATTEPVSIDLNGFAIQGSGGGGGGIAVASATPGCPYLEVFDGYIRGMAGDGIDGGSVRVLECNDLHIDGVHRGIVAGGSLTVEGCLIERCAAEGIAWEKNTPQSVVLVVDDCEIVGCQSTGVSVAGDWSVGTGTASITQTDVVSSAGNGILVNVGAPQGSGRLSASIQDVRASQCGGGGVALFAPPSAGSAGPSLTVQCEDVVCTSNSSSGFFVFGGTLDLIDCAAVENSLHGFHLDSVQGSIDNCVASKNSGDGVVLLAACRMSVSENAAQDNGQAGIHIGPGVSSVHVADNDVRDQAIGIQDQGTNTLMVRNSATGNGTNYALGSTPAVIVTAAQLATNTNPHANYSLP